jgi:uncharacterized membrane protein YphA (DoxX/SURF4 family)
MTTTLRILHWLSRIILANIFIYSGFIKTQATLQFAVAITSYQLVPESLILTIATYFPWIEIALGEMFLIGWKIRRVATAATGLLLFFTVMLTITYARGIEANCGCFSFNDRITIWTILRDSLILIPALYLLFENRFNKRSKTALPAEAVPIPSAE